MSSSCMWPLSLIQVLSLVWAGRRLFIRAQVIYQWLHQWRKQWPLLWRRLTAHSPCCSCLLIYALTVRIKLFFCVLSRCSISYFIFATRNSFGPTPSSFHPHHPLLMDEICFVLFCDYAKHLIVMKSILASYILSEIEDRVRKPLLQFFLHQLDDLFLTSSRFHIRVYPFLWTHPTFSIIYSQHLYQDEFNLEQSGLAEVWGSAVWMYQPALPRDSSVVCCNPSGLISPQSGPHLLSQARVCISLEMCKGGMSNLRAQTGEQSPACGGRVQVHAFPTEVGISSLWRNATEVIYLMYLLLSFCLPGMSCYIH